MPKGPNSFFVAPDSDLILSGTISSSNDATGLYSSKTVSGISNSGSMSSFVIGTPSSNTTFELQIQDSGSNYSGTFIQKTVGTSSSDDTLIFYGEPDRRFIWDIHNPLLKNYEQVYTYSSSSPPTGFFWEDTLTNETVTNIQGVYFSVLDKEFIYVTKFTSFKAQLWVASRDIKNYEKSWDSQGQITTVSSYLSTSDNLNAIDVNKRGIDTNYEPVFSICEHIDGKLKLAIKFNDEIDIYESSDGVSFTLIAKNILSRFKGERFVNHFKLASSGPYLKIAFVSDIKFVRFEKLSPIVTTEQFIGSITSSDGGASWDYTDEEGRKSEGKSGIRVLLSNSSVGNQNYSYDLCGMSDGSGRFILAVTKDFFTEEDVSVFVQGFINNGYPSSFISAYVSTGNSPFEEKKQLVTHNLEISGRPYLATSNDWIWLLVTGAEDYVVDGWERQEEADSFCGSAYAFHSGLASDSFYRETAKENSIFYLDINCDLNKDTWKILGADEKQVEVAGPDYFFPPLKTGKTTGALGSYFFIPSSGNLYSCGPYMAFCGIGWPSIFNQGNEPTNIKDYGSFSRSLQYYRFSGWLLRPPYVNLGLNPLATNIIDNVDKFIHQENGILSVAEFNYIWGKPKEHNVRGNSFEKTMWLNRSEESAYAQVYEDALLIYELNSYTNNQSNFYYFRCPTVAHAFTWTFGDGQKNSIGIATENANDTDVRSPMFPLTMKVTDNFDIPFSSWIQPKRLVSASKKTDGCCIQFVFGGVLNGSTTRNSVGIKINSFCKNSETIFPFIAKDAILYEYFLRMEERTLKLMSTSDAPYSDIYRETSNITVITLSLGASASNTFENSFWEGRLSFNHNYEVNNKKVSIVLSVRRLGTEEWQDSSIVTVRISDHGNGVAAGSDLYKFLGFQGISFGLFPDSASTHSRRVKFRSLKVCQGSDMTHAQMIINNANSNLPPARNLIRGRQLSPNPIYLGAAQSVSWGGIGGKFGDTFITQIKSSYNVENTFKISSPRFEYRTKGDNTSNIKASKAEIVYQLPNDIRSDNTLGNFGLHHTGVGFFNVNAQNIKIEYSDTSDFSSSVYTIGEKSLKLIQGRVSNALNNKLQVSYDGELAARNINDTRYTSTTNSSFYLKFTNGSLQDKSYKILKSNGANLILNSTDVEMTSAIAGSTIQIYSDRMVAVYSQFPNFNKYMRVTLTCQLGTTDYLKLGSITAGVCFSLERVPINWETSMNISGNNTEFNSRSNVRWAYQEGPSVKTFTGEIIGDVFDSERENIKNIAEQATQYNAYPVAMVFDGDASTAFDVTGDDSSAKAVIDSENILYGTINPDLQMVNEGWQYNSVNQNWKFVGNLQLTIIEVV